jgi:hypothetical protein
MIDIYPNIHLRDRIRELSPHGEVLKASMDMELDTTNDDLFIVRDFDGAISGIDHILYYLLRDIMEKIG